MCIRACVRACVYSGVCVHVRVCARVFACEERDKLTFQDNINSLMCTYLIYACIFLIFVIWDFVLF